VKKIVIYLMLFAITAISFGGCCDKEVQYVDRNVTVNIPVKCHVKHTFCTDEGSIKTGTIVELLECVYELRQSNKSCQ